MNMRLSERAILTNETVDDIQDLPVLLWDGLPFTPGDNLPQAALDEVGPLWKEDHLIAAVYVWLHVPFTTFGSPERSFLMDFADRANISLL